jgi:tryptophanyl-tRNA synthetase
MAVVPGTDGRKMSKSYGNVVAMFAPAAEIKRAVMGIVTDSTPVDAPKDVRTPLFQLWALFASPAEREETFERARRGGLGYGDVKKDLLARLLAHFEPMRERREALAKQPDEVEDVLSSGAARARALAEPVLAAAREAAGLGGPRSASPHR